MRPGSASGANASVRTVGVSTGSVSATASADGTVQPAEEVAANFETSGTVASVRVEVGDVVKAGKKLATLETKDAERAVTVAKLSLEAAQESLDTARAGVTTTEPDKVVVDQEKVARRKAAVTRAQTATQQAQGAVQAGQEALAAAKKGMTATDPATGQPVTTVDQAAVKAAQAQLRAAQKAYDEALDAQTAAEVSLAKAQAGTTVAGKSTTTVDQAQVASARARVIEAQATYDDAKAALAACKLKAPSGGTVLAVNGKVGSSVGSASGSSATSGGGTGTASASGSDFIVIADLDVLDVSVAFAESDVADIAVGQAASITFPGLDDATGAGEVTTISPTATSSSGVVTYAALVRITEFPDGLRLGQTASVTITTDSVDEATIVPSVAVATSGGRSTVTVVGDDGSQVVTPVQVGVVGADYSQIVSGVESGQRVVLTSAESGDSSNGVFGPGGGFPGGFPGGGQPPAGGGALRGLR